MPLTAFGRCWLSRDRKSVGATPVDIVVDHSTYYDMDGRFWAMGTTSPGSKIR
jgi:hypothetical protein